MKVLKGIGKFFSFIGVFLLVLIISIYCIGLIFCYGPSVHARNLFVTTLLETGQMKFAVKLFMSDAKVKEIVDSNKMEVFDEEIDNTLINTESEIDNGFNLYGQNDYC